MVQRIMVCIAIVAILVIALGFCALIIISLQHIPSIVEKILFGMSVAAVVLVFLTISDAL